MNITSGCLPLRSFSEGSGSGSDRNYRNMLNVQAGSSGTPAVYTAAGPAGSVAGGSGSGGGRSEAGLESTPRLPVPFPGTGGSASVAGVPTSMADSGLPPNVSDVSDELAASRASFKMAMGNPCAEYFVDVM